MFKLDASKQKSCRHTRGCIISVRQSNTLRILRPLRLIVLLLVLSFLGISRSPLRAQAAIPVTTATDSPDCATAPVGSLRAALCGPLNPGDVINITVPGPIVLVANLPPINVGGQGLTINGTNPTTTIQGGIEIRIFTVAGGTLAINDLTITGGNCGNTALGACPIVGQSGGGIYNLGILIVTNSIFVDNAGWGGGIRNAAAGSMLVTDSTFSANNSYLGNGGGIRNDGTATVTNSTFSDNAGAYGAGISNTGILTVTNSTFSTASITTNSGAGISNEGSGTATVTGSTFSGTYALFGAGIANRDAATLTVLNSTFSGNETGAVIWEIGNGSTITNSTFSNNVGTVINNGTSTFTLTNVTFSDNNGRSIVNGYGGSVNMRNSLIAGGSISNCDGPITTNGAAFNFSTDGTCGAGFTPNVTNLNLGVLGNYGGPTQTIPLLVGSAALGAGEAIVCPTTDQRGVVRALPCSIGAFEGVYTSPVQPTVLPAENTASISTAPPLCFDPSYQSVLGVRAEVPAEIASIDGVLVNLFCEKLDSPAEHGVADGSVILAVEVSAFTRTAPNSSMTRLNQQVKICLQGVGTLLYRDATGAPRVVADAPNITFENGYTCARISNVGTLILTPGQMAPSPTNESLRTGCEITTLNPTNFRATPDGNAQVFAIIPYNTRLLVTGRSGDWMKVIYLDEEGYVNASVVTSHGACGG